MDRVKDGQNINCDPGKKTVNKKNRHQLSHPFDISYSYPFFVVLCYKATYGLVTLWHCIA